MTGEHYCLKPRSRVMTCPKRERGRQPDPASAG